MKIIQLDEKTIEGISIRTTNAKEMNPDTSTISALCQQFDEKVTVDYAKGFRVYNLYYNYESDASGEFSVLAGTDQISQPQIDGLETVIIPKGKYILFEAKGSVPRVVIETWTKIWDYFEDNNEFERSYTVDFEFYKSQNEIEVYIAVK